MRTILIYDGVDEDVQAFSIPGDFTSLDDVYIGTCENNKKEDELLDLLYDGNHELNHKPVPINKLHILIRKYVAKDIDFVFIKVGEV